MSPLLLIRTPICRAGKGAADGNECQTYLHDVANSAAVLMFTLCVKKITDSKSPAAQVLGLREN
jgi:hypothetical protein